MLRKILVRLSYMFSTKMFLKIIEVKYGQNCRFIDLSLKTFGSEAYLITIGNNVTISAGVRFINHDGGVWVFRGKHPKIDIIKPIIIGNNVFIGMNSIILPGVVVGDNTVIGAGSVVSGNLPGNAVYAGVPARQIHSIEDYETSMVDQSLETKGMPYKEKKKQVMALVGSSSSD